MVFPHCTSSFHFDDVQYHNLSLGVKISAIWLANTECIYPIFSQQSAISDILAVQYEMLDAKHQAITNTYQKTERKHSTPHLKNLIDVICRGAVDSASNLYSEGWVFEPRLGYVGVLSRNMLTHANTRLRTYFLQNFMLFSMRARMSSRNVVNALKFQV